MRHLLTGLVSLIALTSAAHAAPTGKGDVAIYGGQYDVFGSGSDNKSVAGGIEYRFADQYHGLRPTIGVMGNTDKALYGYAGAYWDLPLSNSGFYFTPGIAAGAYSHGDSKDLGYGLEFRSTAEVTYRMDSGQRVGVALSHLSNAGLGDKNPGVETLQAVYSFPF